MWKSKVFKWSTREYTKPRVSEQLSRFLNKNSITEYKHLGSYREDKADEGSLGIVYMGRCLEIIYQLPKNNEAKLNNNKES